jgi:hypothetical protein
MNPCSYTLLNLAKASKIYNEENIASSINITANTAYLHAENWNKIYVFHIVQYQIKAV